MRLWIGPDCGFIDLDSEGLLDSSHSMIVADDPERFGLKPAPVEAHLESCRQGDFTDFDYDTIIVMAEMNGWVRVSRDAGEGAAAVSASHPRHARKAIRALGSAACDIHAVDLEIERVEGDAIWRRMHRLRAEELARFIDRGVLPGGDAYLTPISNPELTEALEPDFPELTPA